MSATLRGALALALAGLWAVAGAAEAAKKKGLAPIAPEEAVSTHSPFETGECGFCHAGDQKARKGGKLLRSANQLCFDCHEDFRAAVKNHPASKAACISCHSPHNAKKRKLLL